MSEPSTAAARARTRRWVRPRAQWPFAATATRAEVLGPLRIECNGRRRRRRRGLRAKRHDLARGSVTASRRATRARKRHERPVVWSTRPAVRPRPRSTGGSSSSGAPRPASTTSSSSSPATGLSRVVAALPTVRADVTAAVAGGRIVLIGGFVGTAPQSLVWAHTRRTPPNDHAPGPSPRPSRQDRSSRSPVPPLPTSSWSSAATRQGVVPGRAPNQAGASAVPV